MIILAVLFLAVGVVVGLLLGLALSGADNREQQGELGNVNAELQESQEKVAALLGQIGQRDLALKSATRPVDSAVDPSVGLDDDADQELLGGHDDDVDGAR